jgi:hypothetical protein
VFYLFINIKLLILSKLLSTKNQASFDINHCLKEKD